MKRREFLGIVGGAAAPWPVVVRAQPGRRLPTVGFLGSGTPTTAGPWVAAFTQRLRDLGWIEDRTIKIDLRWAEGRNDRSAEIAADFVRLKLDLIVTYSTEHSLIAKQATATIPIVATLVGNREHWAGHQCGRVRKAISPVYQRRTLILPANVSNSCERSSLRCVVWRSCSTSTIRTPRWRSTSSGGCRPARP